METIETVEKLKFYQGRFDMTPFFKDVDVTPGIRPVKIWERVLFTPDINAYLCESQPSIFFEVLDYCAEFSEEVYENNPEVVEAWDEALIESDKQGYYMHRWDIMDRSGNILFDHSFQGEWAKDEQDEAVDWAFGNHLI